MKTHLLIIATLISFAPLSLFAQDIQHKVTPRVIDREVKPRDIFTEMVTIENFTGRKIDIYPSVNIVNVNEGGDIIDFTSPAMSNNKVTASSWIEIQRTGVELMPGEKRELPLTVRIHPEAQAGVYHVFIGFGSGTNKHEAETQVKNGVAPGIIVTLSVAQERNEFLKLGNFLIEKFVTSPENSAISYTLSNPGDAVVIPKGEIIVSNAKGEEVASVAINPNGEPLAPGAETTFTATAPMDGLMGKYKALLSVDYGTNQLASVYDTTFYYVVPWQKLAIGFVIFVVLAAIATLILHRFLVPHEAIDDDEHGAEYVPLFVRESRSEDKDHDINLKKTQ